MRDNSDDVENYRYTSQFSIQLSDYIDGVENCCANHRNLTSHILRILGASWKWQKNDKRMKSASKTMRHGPNWTYITHLISSRGRFSIFHSPLTVRFNACFSPTDWLCPLKCGFNLLPIVATERQDFEIFSPREVETRKCPQSVVQGRTIEKQVCSDNRAS